MNGSEIVLHKPAPDFELADSEGRQIRLSGYRGERHVVLIFNRGFI
ncbi:redoxin domain-containing protein [Syntrophus aciditrophicus]